jgi:hypothetical protein
VAILGLDWRYCAVCHCCKRAYPVDTHTH